MTGASIVEATTTITMAIAAPAITVRAGAVTMTGRSPAAFIAGAIVGGAIANQPTYRAPTYRAPAYRTASQVHLRWCQDRYRSYRAYDNTFQPYYGPRQQCISPYMG